MTTPVRLQLSRRKGFDLQAHSRATNGLQAVHVARPTKWGNPFVVGQPSGIFDGKDGRPLGICDQMEILIGALTLDQVIEFYRDAALGMLSPEMFPWGHKWRERFQVRTRGWLPCEAARAYLRGKNLACFCSLDHACHADVLLEIANK